MSFKLQIQNVIFSIIPSSLKDNLSGELVEKAGVSIEQLPQIFDQIGNVAKEKFGAEAASGNMDSLINLFSKTDNTAAGISGIEASLTSGIVSSLGEKCGLDNAKASRIANIVVPKLIELISNQGSDSSFLTDMLGGDKAGGIMGKAKDALGGLF